MEEKLFGDYIGYTSRRFTKKELLEIRQGITDGVLIRDLAKHYGVGERVIRSIFRQFIVTMDSLKIHNKSTTRLGSKTESYYESEEEMLMGPPNYKWEDLDVYERKFYLNNGRKFQQARDSRKN